jgi:pimeloyl-ACP methyl ester carboxylesterase
MDAVVSSDGVRLAGRRSGSGPGLVLVHGTGSMQSRWASVLPYLETHFSVTTFDRRGRGGSGDADDYDIKREFEDVAAVVESLDTPTMLLGHSYGALLALEAALLTRRLFGLVLYEPVIADDGPSPFPEEMMARLEESIRAGEGGAAVVMFMREFVGLSAEQLAAMRSSPDWPVRVAAAHTLAREQRAEERYRFQPERFADLRIPVLLLLGSDSPGYFRTALERLGTALPNSRLVVMPGQQHIAMITAPELFARVIVDFWHAVAPRPDRLA